MLLNLLVTIILACYFFALEERVFISFLLQMKGLKLVFREYSVINEPPRFLCAVHLIDCVAVGGWNIVILFSVVYI